jgi:hypothetical protein
MTPAQRIAAREERTANAIAKADRDVAAKAAQSPLGRIATGEELRPEDFTDEELATLFPAFGAVWTAVIHRLAEMEGVRIG